MKIVQTFWTANQPEPFKIKGGWISPEYHWMSWAMSTLQANKLYGKVELVTDEYGKEILTNVLKLPYSSVRTDLQKKMATCSPELWSLAKVYSYSIQQEPFIHIDGDVFLWKKFDIDILNAPVIAQNQEVNLFYYREMLFEIRKYFTYIPHLFPEGDLSQQKIYASNTGIFGGQNLKLIKHYCVAVFNFIRRNKGSLNKIDKLNFNFIYEQCLLYYLTALKGIPVTYVMKEPVEDPLYAGYVRFTDIPDVDFIHTVGGYKGMPFICNQLARRLRQCYPDYYYLIIDLCKKQNIPLLNKVYYGNDPYKSVPFGKRSNNISIKRKPLRFKPVEEKRKALVDGFKTDGLNMQFKRTTSFLIYTKAIEPIADQSGRSFSEVQNLVTGISKRKVKTRAEEIFKIEYYKTLLENFLLRNTEAIYHIESDNDIKAGQLFNKSYKEGIDAIKVKVSNISFVFETKWQWEGSLGTAAAQIFKDVLANDESFYLLVLVPDPLLLLVQEYFLDNLDSIIVSCCLKEKYIYEIINEAGKYFDVADIQNNPDAFRYLLLSSIKRLVYCGILQCG